MNRNESQTTQGNGADVADLRPLRPGWAGEASLDDTRRKLYEISYMVLDVYNAVGEYERPSCKCEDYKQQLRLAQQKLQGTLEANRALSMENEKLRVMIEHHRRDQRVNPVRGPREHDDLYVRMKDIESSFQQIMQDHQVPPPPPPKVHHVAKHMRSNLEEKSDGKTSFRDRVKAVLFEPGDA